MIYIDQPIFKRKNGRVKYCHMTADTIEELHAFAKEACIPRHWFEYSNSGIPHYDLNPQNREKAIKTLERK